MLGYDTIAAHDLIAPVCIHRFRANNAFKLWSKHESKVPSIVLSQKVVQCGDILLKAQVSHQHLVVHSVYADAGFK